MQLCYVFNVLETSNLRLNTANNVGRRFRDILSTLSIVSSIYVGAFGRRQKSEPECPVQLYLFFAFKIFRRSQGLKHRGFVRAISHKQCVIPQLSLALLLVFLVRRVYEPLFLTLVASILSASGEQIFIRDKLKATYSLQTMQSQKISIQWFLPCFCGLSACNVHNVY